MRGVLGLLIVLAMAAPVAADHLQVGDGLIVPGSRIGPIRLGTHQKAIEALNQVAACPVSAAYDDTGTAVRMTTEWGGACRVTDHIQVGFGGLTGILLAFGRPESVELDAVYAQSDALWMTYTRFGIAFRVLVIRNSQQTMIQAIAVFRGENRPSL